ncbi:MAG TPA: MFS transporter [Thermoleophilaceae bacterium]|nr:MFS transporter [Thermoleophilaceae bacterium]
MTSLAEPRTGVDRRGMGVLALGHMLVDSCQGAVPALLPFLVSQRGYSYAAASGLILAATVSSSVIQPFFGHFSDRRSLAWLLVAGPVTAGAGIALVGITHTYPMTFLAVVLSGIGVAAYHPEASRFANYVSGAKRASGMSLFSVGGNLGFALGPVLVTPLVLGFGLSGTLFMAIPGAVGALVVLANLPHLVGFRPAHANDPQNVGSPDDDWAGFRRLGGVIAFRTFVYFGLVTFVPLYYTGALGTSKAAANTALTAMLIGGAFGTLIGGPLADRFSRRAVLFGSMTLLPPLILLFHALNPPASTFELFFIGAAVIATFSVTVVMGQEYLPGRIGTASGVTLGLSIGLGGLGAPLLGLVADRWGLNVTLYVLAVLPLGALALTFTLPPARSRRTAVGSPPGWPASTPPPARSTTAS